MVNIERATRLAAANLNLSPLPSLEALREASDVMIKGASGWRKVFAPESDEESFNPQISGEDTYLVALATQAFYQAQCPKEVIIGVDTRPSGPIIADIVVRRLLTLGVEVKYLFVAAAPEIMAYSLGTHFIYISASHNPVGYNGFKFGFNGGVLSGDEAREVLNQFNTLIKRPTIIATLKREIEALNPELYRSVINKVNTEKERALSAYTELSLETLANGDEVNEAVKVIREGTPLGIVGELNGSARSLSIDRHFFESLGLKSYFVNDKPGEIVHQIVPEGPALELCREILSQQHKSDNAFRLGYVPDNDGDRGNIVYTDERDGETHILTVQHLFALVALIELTLSKKGNEKRAIVVNGPTSLMVDKIAAKLGASLFRCEVGEANLVTLAQQKREEGWHVRLLGEGSNGGSITHPSRVRDPLNTLVALIKLLSSEEIFYQITGLKGEPSIARALEILPKRTITESFSPQGVMQVDTSAMDQLKEHYEELFLMQFEERKEELAKRFGIFSFRGEQTEGTQLKRGLGAQHRTPPMLGGLKILFQDDNGEDTDFIWMRPSGTEPLFRVVADALGDNRERHDYLIEWQRQLVEASALKCQR